MRSAFYYTGIALFFASYYFFQWWGVAVLAAFAIGYHVCYRVERGKWMPPED